MYTRKDPSTNAAPAKTPTHRSGCTTCATTYLRAGGADIKEVQETLGHATQALTSDTYTSVLLEFQRAYADTVGDLIPRTPPAA